MIASKKKFYQAQNIHNSDTSIKKISPTNIIIINPVEIFDPLSSSGLVLPLSGASSFVLNTGDKNINFPLFICCATIIASKSDKSANSGLVKSIV